MFQRGEVCFQRKRIIWHVSRGGCVFLAKEKVVRFRWRRRVFRVGGEGGEFQAKNKKRRASREGGGGTFMSCMAVVTKP